LCPSPLFLRIDRLARSIADLQDIVRTLKARGAALRATEQPINTATAPDKCFLDMLGVPAEFETNLRREREWWQARCAPSLCRPLGSTFATPHRRGDCALSRQADELREWRV
jgi:hypothetical protein